MSDGPSPKKVAIQRKSRVYSTQASVPKTIPEGSQAQDERIKPVKKKLHPKRSSSRASSPVQSPETPWVAKSTGGKIFTNEEIRLLRKEYDDILNLDQNAEFDAWAAWSIKVRSPRYNAH